MWVTDPDTVCRDASGLVSSTQFSLLAPFYTASLIRILSLSLSLSPSLSPHFPSFAFVSHDERFSLTICIYGVIAV